MRIKAIVASVTAVAVMALGATGASAATEFGSSCSGNELELGDYTMMTASGPNAAAPSSGVITQLKVSNGEPLPFQIPYTVKVLRPTGGNQYTNVGQDTVLSGPGTSTKDTRISVQAGDRLGLRGQPFTYEGSLVPSLYLYCAPVPGSVLGYVGGDLGVGSTAAFEEAPEAAAPVSARLEPDADNDGYGDETQDKCPQNATVQIPCPVAALSLSSVVRKSFVKVLVTSTTQSSVTVAGKVKLGKGKTAKLSGNTQIVVPGTISKFTLIFPAELKSKLKTLGKKQSLQLALTATAGNVAAAPTVSTLKAKVKGQKKPARKAKGKKGGKQG
jgi:hypothetical protein